MKNIKIFKICSISILMSLFVLFGCQQDDITSNVKDSVTVDKPSKEEGLQVRLVSDKEIPHVVGLLKNKLSSKAKIKGNKIKQENIVISLDNVKEAFKKGEHINYNFAVHIDGDYYADVYVLSVDEETDGSLGEPIVIKYSIDPKSFDYFLENDGVVDYQYLKADYTYYDLDTFLATGGKSNLLKSSGCHGTFGSAPGEYPQANPGESFIHNAFGFSFTISFSFSTTSGNYVYTSTVTSDNGQQSNVSTIGSSDIVTTESEIVGTTSDNIIPDDAESVTDTGNVGGGQDCILRQTVDADGGFHIEFICPNADEDNTQRSNKSARGICAPMDYNALNLTDLRVEYVNWALPNVNREFLEENREFATPLVAYENGTRMVPNNHVFPGKVMAGVEAGNIGEIQGLQILYYTNQNGYSPESVALASDVTDAINNGQIDQNDGISLLNFAHDNNNSNESVNRVNEILDAAADGTLLSVRPFVKYAPGTNYENDYPLITEILRDELPKMAEDEFLVNALKKYGSLNNEQIKNALTWGAESSVTVDIGSTGFGWGLYNKEVLDGDENTITLHWDLEEILRNNNTINVEALRFFVAIVTLHEITHLGDYLYNGNMYSSSDPGASDAEGTDFDMEVVGLTEQDPSDADTVYQNYLLKRKE